MIKFCKTKSKQPILLKNKIEIDIQNNELIKYRENLEVEVDVKRKKKRKPGKKPYVLSYFKKISVHNEHRKMGFLGLIINLTTYLHLSKDLLRENFMIIF